MYAHPLDAVQAVNQLRNDQTSDFTVQRSDGRTDKGAEAAWKALAEIYGPFAAHKHDPTFLVTFDVSDGWRMIGVANVYFKFQGSDGGAATDPQGEVSRCQKERLCLRRDVRLVGYMLTSFVSVRTEMGWVRACGVPFLLCQGW